MEGSEELRETIVAMGREIESLRIETTHATLLLKALDAVLCVDGGDDPFAGVFAALLPVFGCSYAIVLIEREGGSKTLECIAANRDLLVGSTWRSGRTFDKVLSGRTVTTVSGAVLEEWPQHLGPALSHSRPALYLPLGVRGHRGLLVLLREGGEPGFDRTHVTLARKFSLLASHAFAAKRANQTEAESYRLKHLTEQLKASQEALTFRANHDQLTGLPNRSYVQELVDGMLACKAPGQKLALAFIDLDDFKRVNDFYGHAMGDALLRNVADRVRGEIRRTDVLGRISGDEFVIALDPVERRAEISTVVARVQARLQQPFRIEGHEIKASGSIGVAFYPLHGRDYDTLRRHADTAMYQAKTSSKGSVAFFSRTLGRKAAEKLSLEHRLRVALAEREFQCALQQKVDIRNHAVAGFEALVRWVDRNGTIHAPGQFLQLANELGLLDDITNIVLDVLALHLPRLDARFGRDVKYSINISAAQATKIAFMQKFIQRVADTGRAGNFMLEVTEDSFLATDSFRSEVLPLIRKAGIGVSVDDFGAGYSSLAVLADITADELKVDRSLIASIHQRPRSQSILRAIESLASALGMSVVSEGVETVEEQDYLLNFTQIQIAQGYLFHKPRLIGEILESGKTAAPVASVGRLEAVCAGVLQRAGALAPTPVRGQAMRDRAGTLTPACG